MTDRRVSDGKPVHDQPAPLVSGRRQRTEAPGDAVTDEQIERDGETAEGWLVYNTGLGQRGYSPADRLTPDTVDTLTHRYTVQFDVEWPGLQANPVVVPGDPPVLYVTTGEPAVRAVNARSGERYWHYDYSPANTTGYGGRNRGVAVRGDAVYLAAVDAKIVALDRYSGEKRWAETVLSPRQREMGRPERMAITQAPVAYDGLIVVGQTGGQGGWGAVAALDAETGDPQWHQPVAPPEQWVGESWRYGDGAPWMSPAIDRETGTVFVPTGNPGPRYNGLVRPGPNRHTDSILALDAATGDVEWAYQTIASDWWDWDVTTTPRVFDLTVAGESRRVVAAENKAGWTYLIDAGTGQLVERTEPYAVQGAELPHMTVPPAGAENAKTHAPSGTGGTAWSPDAYSPDTGYLYVGANDTANTIHWDTEYGYDPSDSGAPTGGSTGDAPEFDQRTRVVAIDPATGGVVWDYEHEDMRPDAWHRAGGNTATGGDLLFAASYGGTVTAHDAATGDGVKDDRLVSRVGYPAEMLKHPLLTRLVVVAGDVENAIGP